MYNRLRSGVQSQKPSKVSSGSVWTKTGMYTEENTMYQVPMAVLDDLSCAIISLVMGGMYGSMSEVYKANPYERSIGSISTRCYNGGSAVMSVCARQPLIHTAIVGVRDCDKESATKYYHSFVSENSHILDSTRVSVKIDAESRGGCRLMGRLAIPLALYLSQRHNKAVVLRSVCLGWFRIIVASIIDYTPGYRYITKETLSIIKANLDENIVMGFIGGEKVVTLEVKCINDMDNNTCLRVFEDGNVYMVGSDEILSRLSLELGDAIRRITSSSKLMRSFYDTLTGMQ
jgi:hypothetical protein